MARLPEKKIQENLDSIKASRTEASRAKAAINAILKSTRITGLRLTKFFDDAQKNVNTSKKDTEQVRKDTKSEYNRFKSTYNAAMNGESGIKIKAQKLTDLHASAKTLQSEISKNATEAKNSTQVIQELQKKATKNEKDVNDIHERANIVKQEIEDTYNIVLDIGLAGTFIERSNKLEIRVRVWQRVYIGAMTLIGIAAILALTISKPDSLVQAITERFVFVTPLIIIAFVSARQFGHERKLLEEYSFKAVTAQSLRGYTILLNEQFKNVSSAPDAILNFTVESMKNIYDRSPIEAKQGMYHFILGNKLARFEAKIDERLDKFEDKIEESKQTIEKAVEY